MKSNLWNMNIKMQILPKKIRKKILYIFHIESLQIDRKSYKLWRIPLFHKSLFFEQVSLNYFRQPYIYVYIIYITVHVHEAIIIKAPINVNTMIRKDFSRTFYIRDQTCTLIYENDGLYPKYIFVKIHQENNLI